MASGRQSQVMKPSGDDYPSGTSSLPPVHPARTTAREDKRQKRPASIGYSDQDRAAPVESNDSSSDHPSRDQFDDEEREVYRYIPNGNISLVGSSGQNEQDDPKTIDGFSRLPGTQNAEHAQEPSPNRTEDHRYNKQLRYSSIIEARAGSRFSDKTVPSIGSDDIAAIKNDVYIPRWVVKRILDACLSPSIPQYQTNEHFDEAEWKRWNEKQKEVVRVIVKGEGNDPEAMAWLLLEEIFTVQERGIMAETKRIIPDVHLSQIKCSERIDRVIAALENCPLAAKDMLEGKRNKQLAAAPEWSTAQKWQFKRNNKRKANKTKKNEETGGASAVNDRQAKTRSKEQDAVIEEIDGEESLEEEQLEDTLEENQLE
ncbi:hypothetical protein CB0940_07379 [Cercospora beticola]|uniref:Uncharacterized protein n=2 Tax=Cercospora beticola TaxID=122368 RepID=A0A2G5H7S7_CERBT|nr:hypothetical protein CB0940_07379 [Cercospora beticola]PIA88587.1 hypothetical protein CB0940_07379 [Cercospora beticola]